jgi:flagellar biosynthesis/type III secretory pathway protein FliH
MRAISIAEYLSRSGHGLQRERNTERAGENTAGVAESLPTEHKPASPLIYLARRVAAPPSTNGESSPHARADAEGGRNRSEASAARETAATQEIDAWLAQAYERGRREGAAAAAAEAAQAHAGELAALTEQAAAERLAFRREEYARLSAEIAAGLEAVEERIGACVARILAPVLEAEKTEQAVRELRDAILRLCGSGSPGLMKIRGPEDLLAKLREALADVAIDVEYREQAGVDVTVEASGARISTGLQAWKDLLAPSVE